MRRFSHHGWWIWLFPALWKLEESFYHSSSSFLSMWGDSSHACSDQYVAKHTVTKETCAYPQSSFPVQLPLLQPSALWAPEALSLSIVNWFSQPREVMKYCLASLFLFCSLETAGNRNWEVVVVELTSIFSPFTRFTLVQPVGQCLSKVLFYTCLFFQICLRWWSNSSSCY